MKPADVEELIFTVEDFEFKQDSIEDKKLLAEKYNFNYSRMLSYWIKKFMIQKRSTTTNKQVNEIIKYLFVRKWVKNEGIEEYKYISNTELRRKFVGDNRHGRPKNNPGFQINNRETLEKLLKELVEDELLQTTQTVERTARSNPNKEKKTRYYRINTKKISDDSVGIGLLKEKLYAYVDQKLTKQELIQNMNELIYWHINVHKNFERFSKNVAEECVDIDVILHVMKNKYGITVSDEQIIKELKDLQAWKSYCERKRPLDFYEEDEWGNITIIPSD